MYLSIPKGSRQHPAVRCQFSAQEGALSPERQPALGLPRQACRAVAPEVARQKGATTGTRCAWLWNSLTPVPLTLTRGLPRNTRLR